MNPEMIAAMRRLRGADTPEGWANPERNILADLQAWADVYCSMTGVRPDTWYIRGLTVPWPEPRPWKHHSQGHYRQRRRR
jgi:hypothetical protein